MRQETYNKLKEYENYLFTASKLNYIRSLTKRQVDELYEIGRNLGEALSSKTCPSCILNFCKRLAKHYYEYQEQQEKSLIIDPNFVTTETIIVEDKKVAENEEEVPNKPKKKTTKKR